MMNSLRSISLAALGAAVLAAPAAASTVPVNGVWAGQRNAPMCDSTGRCVTNAPQDIMFRLTGKRLSGLRFSTAAICGFPSDPESHDIYFTGGSGLPRTARLNARDAVSVTFRDTDRLALDRVATVTLALTFRGARPLASVKVVTSDGTAPCEGDVRQIPLTLTRLRGR